MTTAPSLSARRRGRVRPRLAAAAGVLLVVAACGRDGGVPRRVHELTGDRPERLAAAEGALFPGGRYPTAPRDARCAEERLGDGVLGPADAALYCRLDVAPEEVAAWIAVLTPRATPAGFAAPSTPPAWWLSAADFAGLEQFEALRGPRQLGWVVVDRARGRIYAHSMST